ncbi:unnamed protein product [Allacma fusca]|uniref:Uncharacterized protein n=1 Tax=Allacma fusca TaxID=39272 RepID=A0A8J2NQL9_9HEXA|nr:unnamed protein product [Allacma fusca]
MLAVVPPLGFEVFYAAGKLSIEAALAYEVEGTDMGLLVAIKAQGDKNTAAALFLPKAHFIFDDILDGLLDQNQWNYLLRHKFTYAKDGEQICQARNIRASLKMTEGQKSQVEIRLYAV